MQLSLRLSAIAGLVTRGNRLVDVGCDHGYLPVSLYLDGKITGAIAMDVRKGPLSSQISPIFADLSEKSAGRSQRRRWFWRMASFIL